MRNAKTQGQIPPTASFEDELPYADFERRISDANYPSKSATLIYNPVAGRKPAIREKQVREAAGVLSAAGITVTLAPTSGPGAAADLARAASRAPGNLVLACGGDGTINEVINGMTPGRATLGILPGGTANIIAKELGLPHDPATAARQLPNWRPRRIALGRVTWAAQPNEGSGGVPAEDSRVKRRYFLSVAGVGFDAHVVYRLSFEFKMSFGTLAYVIEAVRQVLKHSFPRFVCRPGGQELDRTEIGGQELEATLAIIHRTKRYAGWFKLAPSANLFEPKFALCIFRSHSRWRYFTYAAAAGMRLHPRLRDVTLLDTPSVSCRALDADPPIHFEVDGELAGKLPATFEVVPDALTLLVP